MASEKTLKRIVIILGVILVVGFFSLVGIIIYRAMNMEETEVEAIETQIMSTPENPVKLIRHGKNDKITIFIFQNAEGKQSVMVIDNQTQEVLGQMQLDEMDEDIQSLIKED